MEKCKKRNMQNAQNKRSQLYNNIEKQNITQEQMLNYSLQKQNYKKIMA